MKKYIVFILSSIFVSLVQAQQPVTWDDLAKVRWMTGYDQDKNVYYDIPQPSQEIKDLNNKIITIQGFYVPIDSYGEYFALSLGPSSMCFFCNVGGLETVMEIRVKKGHRGLRRVEMDKYIELKGRFVLNVDSSEYLMYILEDAELVSIIK